MNQYQHLRTSEPADRTLLLDPRAHFLSGSGDTTVAPFLGPNHSSNPSTALTWGGNNNPYSHWYINSVQQPSFDPAKDAYERAVEILRKELTAAERQLIRLGEHNSIQDVRLALDKALEEYQKKAKGSKVRDWLAKCSSRVMYYGAVFDTFSQHHPEYVSLAWGAFKFLFIAVLNYEELLVEVSKAVSRIADVLPRTELHSLLYSTPRMQETVAQLYAKILEFSIMAIRFYKKGKLSHSIASIVKPFSLTFKPIIEEIRERSIRVDELASALSKAEIRDLHVKINGLSQSVVQLTEMVALQSQSLLSFQTQHKRMFQNTQIDAIRSAVLIAETPVAADSLDWCRSMRNRRRQKSFAQLPLPELSKLKLWVSDSSSSLLLAQGRGVSTSALDFATDFIDIVTDHDYPVIWALPSSIFDSSEETARVSMSGVLKSLISQILTVNPDLVVDGVNPLTAHHFNSVTTIKQWFNIFDRCVVSSSRLFVVVDISLIEMAPEHEESEDQSFGTDEFIEEMMGIVSRKVTGGLKVVVASWRFNSFTKLDAEEVFSENYIYTDRGRRVEMMMKQPRFRAADRGKHRQITAKFRSSMA
ncbi:nacht domain protein [Colletotrichum kahawae]|uniref:Nacht domain protein n=1 Tax=Colletotrichum kahawae TaxID=34407 RepID=A0AAD9YVD1_COLKA|nr:nacht domain protein [Colletotrichum kahawae]